MHVSHISPQMGFDRALRDISFIEKYIIPVGVLLQFDMLMPYCCPITVPLLNGKFYIPKVLS